MLALKNGKDFDCYVWESHGMYKGLGLDKLVSGADIRPLNNSDGAAYCGVCNKRMDAHGLLHNDYGESLVCPGDYVVKDINGVFVNYSPNRFNMEFKLIDSALEGFYR